MCCAENEGKKKRRKEKEYECACVRFCPSSRRGRGQHATKSRKGEVGCLFRRGSERRTEPNGLRRVAWRWVGSSALAQFGTVTAPADGRIAG